MKLKNITFEKSGVDFFWDKYVNKSVFVLPLHAEKWFLIKKNNSWNSIIKKADIFIADGVGLSWGYRYLTGKKVIKISGIDLINQLIDDHPSTPVYLWGTTNKNIKSAAKLFKQKGLNVVGYHDGFVGEDVDIIKDIKKSSAKICLLGNSAKRAAELALKVHKDLGITTMTAGGSFDVASGNQKRAPKLVQKIGLEWLWRMVIEPKRFKRIPALFGFIWYVIKEKVE